MTAARVLTVRQPWASLTALGHKRIEVRTKPTKYRGTVLIQAGAEHPWRARPVPIGDFFVVREQWPDEDVRYHLARLDDVGNMVDLPLGAVVAVADLVDCLPIIGPGQASPGALDGNHRTFIDLPRSGYARRWYWEDGDPTIIDPTEHILLGRDISDQIPYCGGLLVPGNYAYLWANVRPLPEPIPHKGGLGLRHAPDDLYAAAMEHVS